MCVCMQARRAGQPAAVVQMHRAPPHIGPMCNRTSAGAFALWRCSPRHCPCHDTMCSQQAHSLTGTRAGAGAADCGAVTLVHPVSSLRILSTPADAHEQRTHRIHVAWWQQTQGVRGSPPLCVASACMSMSEAAGWGVRGLPRPVFTRANNSGSLALQPACYVRNQTVVPCRVSRPRWAGHLLSQSHERMQTCEVTCTITYNYVTRAYAA